MQKSALLILGVLLFFFFTGLFMSLAPAGFHHARLLAGRFLRLVSRERTLTAMSPSRARRYRLVGIVYLLICAVVFANMRFECGRQKEDAPAPPTASARQGPRADSLAGTVDRIVRPLILGHEYAGLVVSAIADDKHVVAGFGRADLSSERPPDGDTIYEIGSIGKVFTGILLADLVLQKRVTLETPLDSLLTAAAPRRNLASSDGKITLRDLVTHTSGLPRLPRGLLNPYRLWLTISGGNPYKGYTDEDMLDTLSETRPEHPPGQKFLYSNFGFGLLGMTLSRVTAMSYGRMIRTMIAEPLGLKDTTVELNEEQSGRMASGYRCVFFLGPFYLAQASERWDLPECLAGAGAVRSTGNDMLTFLAANMDRTGIRRLPALDLAQTPLFSTDDFETGMAWLRQKGPKTGRLFLWHNGMTGGYASFLAFSGDKRFGVAVLSNSAKSVDAVGWEILKAMVEGDSKSK